MPLKSRKLQHFWQVFATPNRQLPEKTQFMCQDWLMIAVEECSFRAKLESYPTSLVLAAAIHTCGFIPVVERIERLGNL